LTEIVLLFGFANTHSIPFIFFIFHHRLSQGNDGNQKENSRIEKYGNSNLNKGKNNMGTVS
jgi:hypothetical protein